MCLDADEALAAPFKAIARKVYGSLQPGQRCALQWLALWKSADHYRNDQPVWTNNYKYFIFRDDGVVLQQASYLCESRTPIFDEANQLKLKPRHGAVLHS